MGEAGSKALGAERSPTLRDVQRETTRARLVEIVVEMMENGGEQAVRVRAVSDALGASVGAVYHHFGSREEMIVAARIHQFGGALGEDLETIRSFVASATSVEEFRQAVLRLNAEAHGPSRAVYRQQRAEVIGAARHNPDLSAALARTQQERTTDLADIVADAQAKGFLEPSIDPRALATYFQGVALGVSLADVNTIEPLNQEAWAYLAELLLDAILPVGSRRYAVGAPAGASAN